MRPLLIFGASRGVGLELARLERAMATVAGAADAAPYDELIAKRDALLALA